MGNSAGKNADGLQVFLLMELVLATLHIHEHAVEFNQMPLFVLHKRLFMAQRQNEHQNAE